MLRNNLSKTISLVVLVIILLMLPFALGRYHLDILVMLLINIILVISFRLITTMGGWSFAHIVMMGLGSYATALMAKTFGWPFWLTLPLSVLSVALVAWIISSPLVRAKLFAFFLASFAIGEAIRLSWTRLQVPFGSHQGITNIPVPESIPLPGLRTLDFGSPIPYYFLVLVVVLLCVAIMYRLEKSRIVDTFKAIYSQDSLMKSVGINVAKYKTLAFVIGCSFAGIAGVLFAHHYRSIDPTCFSFINLLYLLVWVVVGGYHTFAGPIIGVSVLTVIREGLRPVIEVEWLPMIYGFILIFTMLFLPGGLESLPKPMSPLVKRIQMMSKRIARNATDQ